jgi:hypothetical protein
MVIAEAEKCLSFGVRKPKETGLEAVKHESAGPQSASHEARLKETTYPE